MACTFLGCSRFEAWEQPRNVHVACQENGNASPLNCSRHAKNGNASLASVPAGLKSVPAGLKWERPKRGGARVAAGWRLGTGGGAAYGAGGRAELGSAATATRLAPAGARGSVEMDGLADGLIPTPRNLPRLFPSFKTGTTEERAATQVGLWIANLFGFVARLEVARHRGQLSRCHTVLE